MFYVAVLNLIFSSNSFEIFETGISVRVPNGQLPSTYIFSRVEAKTISSINIHDLIFTKKRQNYGSIQQYKGQMKKSYKTYFHIFFIS